MDAISTEQDIPLYTLPVFQNGSGRRSVHVDNTTAGPQNHRHAFARWRSGAPLNFLVKVHTVDQVPGGLPELIRLRQVNVPEQLILCVILGNLCNGRPLSAVALVPTVLCAGGIVC